jgi:hypothetical protein
MAVKAIPLANGDLHWVFPQLADPAEVFEVLLRADAQLRRLADHLGVRPGWTGSGLEYLMLDGRSGPERDCRRVA